MQIPRINSQCMYWLLLTFSLMSHYSHGRLPAQLVEEPAAPDNQYQPSQESDDESWDIDMLDWSRAQLSTYIEGLNDGLDRFFAETLFGDEIIDDESSGSNGRIFFKSRRVRGEKSVDYQSGVNVKLALPNTNNRLKLLIETEEEEDDSKESNVVGTTENVTYATSLRVQLQRTERWRTTWDNGISWEGEPVPFSRLRVRRIAYYEDWHTRLYQSLFYRTNLGLGEKTSYSAIRPLSLERNFRFSLNASYLLDDDYFKLSNSYSVVEELSDYAVLVYRFTISGDTQGIEKVNRYTTAMGYRRQLYKNFVFMDFIPEISWPRDKNFEPTPALTFNLEMIFGPD